MIIQYYRVEMITRDLPQVFLWNPCSNIAQPKLEMPKNGKSSEPFCFYTAQGFSHLRQLGRFCANRMCEKSPRICAFASICTPVCASAQVASARVLPHLRSRRCGISLAPVSTASQPSARICAFQACFCELAPAMEFSQVRLHQMAETSAFSSMSEFDPLTIRNSPEAPGTSTKYTNKSYNIIRT